MQRAILSASGHSIALIFRPIHEESAFNPLLTESPIRQRAVCRLFVSVALIGGFARFAFIRVTIHSGFGIVLARVLLLGRRSRSGVFSFQTQSPFFVRLLFLLSFSLHFGECVLVLSDDDSYLINDDGTVAVATSAAVKRSMKSRAMISHSSAELYGC